MTQTISAANTSLSVSQRSKHGSYSARCFSTAGSGGKCNPV